MQKRVLLMILDGWGEGTADSSNAIYTAGTPEIDALRARYPHSHLSACGEDVGLPEGQMGNSEVGHLNIGGGRIVYQDLVKINHACRDHALLQNDEIRRCYEYVRQKGCRLHFLGLCSHGGVHSSLDHLYEFLAEAARAGLKDVFVHCLMDGRDTDPHSGKGFLEELEQKMAATTGRIASVCGRFYTMDRDKRWERVKEAYEALTEPVLPGSIGGSDAVKAAYAMDETDEFVRARVCNGFDAIEDGAAVIFANFRPDRAREITRAFVDSDFDGFERQRVVKDLCYVCMTTYDAAIPNVLVAYPPKQLKNTLGEYVSGLGLTQLRIAETEKYAHVTFFFNGGVEEPYPGEERILIPSPKVATYDLQPSMSAPEVTDAVCAQLSAADCPDFIILNFANCDMVGHTGVFDAAVKAVETVDACVGRVCEAMRKAGGRLFITADHGNADEMRDGEGNVVTAHSTNPVPLIYVGPKDIKLSDGGALCDLAPTMLQLMGLEAPREMEGRSLIARP
jgi:2,3-bisphosphoglycerate-independent phosphoglycerate mutase